MKRALPPILLPVLLLLFVACDKQPAPGKPGGPAGVISFVGGGKIREFDLASMKVSEVRAGKDPSRASTGEDVYVVDDRKLCGKEPEDRCVMIAGTSGAATVAFKACKGCELASLSPDGTLFAYSGYCREKLCKSAAHATFVRERNGRIAHIFPSLGSPAWTPDGRLVLSGDALQGHAGLYLAADLVHDARIDAGIPDPKEPAVSPDGKRIAYRITGADAQIYVVGFDGQNPKKITELGDHTAGWPTWSPDGKWILLQDKEKSWQDGTLAIVSADGGAVVPLRDDQKKSITAGGRMHWRP